MERELSSLRGQFEFGNVSVFQEMLSEIAKGSGNRSSSACCQIRKSGYTSRDASNQHRDNSMNTLEH